MLLSPVNRTFKVLKTFPPDQPELDVTEISSLLKMDKSPISRILMTLTGVGFLERNLLNKKYRLSSKIVGLGNRVMSCYSDIKELANPFMKDPASRIKTHSLVR
jgi:DNA-binding IclR family transcriptional regulator